MRGYAKVVWTAGDVRTLAPQLTEDEANQWLLNNERHIQGWLVEVGWGVIQSLLEYDGIATNEEEGEDNA